MAKFVDLSCYRIHPAVVQVQLTLLLPSCIIVGECRFPDDWLKSQHPGGRWCIWTRRAGKADGSKAGVCGGCGCIWTRRAGKADGSKAGVCGGCWCIWTRRAARWTAARQACVVGVGASGQGGLQGRRLRGRRMWWVWVHLDQEGDKADSDFGTTWE